jgi:hypothetical protein
VHRPIRLDISEEEQKRERERLVRYIVATFDIESGADISPDLSAMARVREAVAVAHEHRMTAQLEDCVIDLPNLAPAASFHHALSLGTLAVICTGERPPPNPEQVRAERTREAERRAAEEEAARETKKTSNVPFIVAVGVVIMVASSMVWAMRSCGDHPKEHDEPADKSEHHK